MSKTSRRLIVTGGRGLIGSAIAWAWHRLGDVDVIDDGRAAVVPAGALPDGCRLLGMSVEHAWQANARLAVGAHAIVHAAAPVGPVAILHGDVLTSMVESTRAACRLAARGDVPLIVLSSSEVHGTTHVEDALVVVDEWSPRQEYQLGKIATEAIARRHAHETGLPTVIVRPWNVTGPWQSAGKGFVLPRWIDAAHRGEPLTVYGDGSQERALMSVGDFAERIVETIDSMSARGALATSQAWHAANPDNRTSMRDLARLVIERTGSRSNVLHVDPVALHGPTFREASAGSKLPPDVVALRGWTPLASIVDRMHAARLANLPA